MGKIEAAIYLPVIVQLQGVISPDLKPCHLAPLSLNDYIYHPFAIPFVAINLYIHLDIFTLLYLTKRK